LDELNTDVEDSRATPEVPSNTKKPYNRITGVGIDINVRYYNMRLHTERTTGHLYAFVDVRARRGWFLGPAHVYYRDFPQIPLESPARSIPRASFSPTGNSVTRKSYGVKYSFEIGGGAIGEFDWQQLKKELIDSMVLFGLVTVVLNLIALYGFGYNSYIYTEQMRDGPLGEIRELYVKKLVYAILFGNDDSVDFEEFKAFLGKYGWNMDEEKTTALWEELDGTETVQFKVLNMYCTSHPMSKIARVMHKAEGDTLKTICKLVIENKIDKPDALLEKINEISTGTFVTKTDCKLALESLTVERVTKYSGKNNVRLTLDSKIETVPEYKEDPVTLDDCRVETVPEGEEDLVNLETKIVPEGEEDLVST